MLSIISLSRIENTTKLSGVNPIDICNKYSTEFQNLYSRLNITNTCFIRTSNPDNHQKAQNMWNQASDDIYLETYTGWYNIREERFVTETEASAENYHDPIYKNPLIKQCDHSYFFRLSKYQDDIRNYILEHP